MHSPAHVYKSTINQQAFLKQAIVKMIHRR